MATYLDRANDIVAAGIDGIPTPPQKQRIADAAIKYRPDLLEIYATDPLNPTSEEKAAVFVETFRDWAKSWLRSMAEKGARTDNDATVTAAGDAAAGDL
jgi:hypothetical protein